MGRTRESAVLASGLQAALGGRGTVCLVSGEPGIGKSYLLTQFAGEAERSGASVHWGLGWEGGGTPAYWPWIQVLRSVLTLEHARAALNEQAHLAATVGQLVPELVPDVRREAPRLEPEQARFQLMDAVSTLLLATSLHTPLVIELDDLHAADADSLSLLEFVARQLRGAKVMLLGSYREAEIQRPKVGNILARIRRAAIQIALGRLSRDEVREYLRAARGERPLEQTVTELYALTEGHPLYLAEVVELGLARGDFTRPPPTVRTAIQERAAELPDSSRSLLAVASVLGRDFDTSALSELAELTPDIVTEQLEPAVAAHFVERGPGGSLRFEHGLVREAFHDSLALAERRSLHERRARRLLSAPEGDLPWAQLAQHLEESGPVSGMRPIDAWRHAAVQADARHAFDDAALCYARAETARQRSDDATGHSRAAVARARRDTDPRGRSRGRPA